MLDTMSIDQMIAEGLVHSLHTSVRRSFRSCRRRWDWIYNKYYYPKETAHYLEFGVAYHKAMEVWYEPTTWDHPDHDSVIGTVAIETFRQLVDDQRRNYIKQMGPLDPEKEQDYDDRVDLGVGMLKYYFSTVSPQMDQDFNPVKVEIPFEVPIKYPDTDNIIRCSCPHCYEKYKSWLRKEHPDDYMDRLPTHIIGVDSEWPGLPVTYGGRVDMLAEDENGRYWIYDWKTTSRLSGLDTATDDSFLLLDDQISSYCWALRELGIEVMGFVYHEQRKAYPLEPEPLKRPYRGRLYSADKQFPTTYKLYMTTILENDPVGYNEGAYEEYLSWLEASGPKFELRHQVHRNNYELDQVGKNIALEALDMTDPFLRIYPSPGKFTCQNCAYRQPCLGMNGGEDYEYTLESMFDKREKHYYETDPPSTDKKSM